MKQPAVGPGAIQNPIRSLLPHGCWNDLECSDALCPPVPRTYRPPGPALGEVTDRKESLVVGLSRTLICSLVAPLMLRSGLLRGVYCGTLPQGALDSLQGIAWPGRLAVLGTRQGGRGVDHQSPQMRHAWRLARVFSRVNRPMLLLGPVGVGKTHLAREIHRASRRSGAFVSLSSGELSGNLYSDTLFGHRPGAFTGASGARRGAFQRAAGGTLLIDDLALLSIPAQSALLRVLESGRYRPLGAEKDETATARLLFAGTRSPEDMLKDGTLLPDFFSRLGSMTVRIPPLSQRRSEIVPLAEHFARAFLDEHGCSGRVEIMSETADLLEGYPWPHNVRELCAAVERATVLAGMDEDPVVLRPSHFPARIQDPPEEDGRVQLTPSLVASAVRAAGGNQSEAARNLGVHRNTVARYLSEAG